MAEDEQTTHTTFPGPPLFWREFTPERRERMAQLRREYLEATGTEAPVRLPELPPDLINLQPPAEPADGRWRCFGDLYTLKDELPSLEEQDIPRLIPAPPAADHPSSKDKRAHADRALVLKRLAKSLLLNFLELVGVMSTRPEHGEEKLQDVNALFMNMEHAINEYRPHQTREQLIALMQEHLDRTRAETAALRAVTDKAKRVLEGLGSIEVPGDEALFGGGGGGGSLAGGGGGVSAERRRARAALGRERGVWDAMDAAFG